MANKIYAAMQAIQNELPRLAKDGDFDGGVVQYKFLAVDDVVKAVRPLLNKHKVLMVSRLVETNVEYNRAEPIGARVPKQSVHVLLTFDFDFISSEDGSTVTTRVIGEGYDVQDKAVRKATTSAQKIAFINTFTIETGEPDLHDASNGAADNEREVAEKPTSSTERRVAKAKAPTESKPVSKSTTSKVNSDLNDAKAKLKSDYIDTGKFTGEELNKKLQAKKKELDLGRLTTEVYEAVLADLEGEAA